MTIEKITLSFYVTIGLVDEILTMINLQNFIYRLKSTSNQTALMAMIEQKLDQHYERIRTYAKKLCFESSLSKRYPCLDKDCPYCHPENVKLDLNFSVTNDQNEPK